MTLPFPSRVAACLFAVWLGVCGMRADPPADFRYEGENLLASGRVVSELKPESGSGVVEAIDGKNSFRLKASKPGGTARFAIPVPVEKDADYLFRAEVKSNDSVLFRFGKLPMAYNNPGQWQTVAGLCRASDPSHAILEVELKPGGSGSDVTAMIRNLSFLRVERPTSIGRRKTSGATWLVKDGKPNAVIVIPATPPAYRTWAETIQTEVKAKTGVKLPILTDRQATAEDYPKLQPRLQGANLLLLGRLDNNRAFWPAYNHFLTAVDGYYPGGNGYVVQTAANVAHKGGNHLIIGASNDAGMKPGIEKFLALLREASTTKGSLQLPWLLETNVQGECRAFFLADDARWKETPENPSLPKPEPGYGNVVRWYQNAMGYYWTGWPSYKERAGHYFSILLKEKAYTHHYIAEFLVRTLDMLDESSLFSDRQLADIDALLLSNFLDVTTVGELHWQLPLAPPYTQVVITSRHQSAPLMADALLSAYLDDLLTAQGGLEELIRFRRVEKERALTHFVTHRNNPNLPQTQVAETYDEFNASLFRFALDQELYREFFGSGNALKALALERIIPLDGQLAFPPGGTRDTRLLLGIMSTLTGDPELYWLWSHLPEDHRLKNAGYFQGRYLGGVRRYHPGAHRPEKEPAIATGIRFTPDPVANLPASGIPRSDCFFSIREGFRPEDDYLAISGVSGRLPAGSVVSLLSRGTVWLERGGQWNNGSGENRLEANTVSATRLDRLPPRFAYDDRSRHLWSGDLATGQAVCIRQGLSNEMEWTREVIRLRKGVFIFRDSFRAKVRGTFLLGINWMPKGVGSRKGDGHLFMSRGGRLLVNVVGDGWQPGSTAPDLTERKVSYRTIRNLKPGQTATIYTVMQAGRAGAEAFLPVAAQGEETLTIGKEPSATVLHFDPSLKEGWSASLLIETPSALGVYDGAPAKGDERRSFVLKTDAVDGPVLAYLEKQRTQAARPAAAGRTAPANPALEVPVTDATASWKQAWRYGGLLKPVRLPPVTPSENGIWDLGEAVDLAEIRLVPKLAHPATLPKTLQLSTSGTGEWKPVDGDRHWRPGVTTRNYGEVHPVEQQDEAILLPSPAIARFIKAEGWDPDNASLHFFTRSRLEARHPVRVETGDFLGNGKRQTLVVSDVPPSFPRTTRFDDLSAALLASNDGTPLFEKDFSGPIQVIRPLDREGDGKKELFVLYANGTLEIDPMDGKPPAKADLYQMHRAFAARYAARKTRAPAGGYVMPFAIGLWRPDGDGRQRMIIGRYGGFTFLSPDLTLEGVLNYPGGFGMAGLLPEGVDFGSGHQEQVAVERWRLFQLGGEKTANKPATHETIFWEQSYGVLDAKVIDTDGALPLAGPKIIRYELLSAVSEKPRFLLLVRGNSLLIYDARQHTVQYRWDSQAPIQGAAVLDQRLQKLEMLLATADGLLWNFHWKNGLNRAPSAKARHLPLTVASVSDGPAGTALLACAEGLYRFTGEKGVEKMAQGAYQSAAPLSDVPGRIVAATANGEVMAFETSREPLP